MPAPPEALRRHEALERAAALLVTGADLDSSLKQAGYRATRSSVVRMTSNIPVIELVAMFASRNCALIANPAFAEFPLIRQSRLSVMPVSEEHWIAICTLAGVKP